MESLGYTGVSQTLEGSLDKTSLREWHMWLAAGAPAGIPGLTGGVASGQTPGMLALFSV